MDDVPPSNPTDLRTRLVERLQHVEEQMQSLHHEREALRNDLEVTDAFLAVWRRTNNVQGPPEQLETAAYPIVDNVPLPVKRPKNPPREQVVDAALEIISERGEPVGRGGLYDALRKAGVHLYGKDPVMVLSTMLWRSQDRIVRLGSNGYWFADRPYPPANYFPETEDLIGVADTEPEDGMIEEPEEDTEVTSRAG